MASVKFKGKIVTHEDEDDRDISAIVSFDDFLAIGSDESQGKIQVLHKTDSHYQVKDKLEIELPVDPENEDQEIDIEGMSINDDNILYIIGSHSLKRSKVKADKTYKKNRKRITKIIVEERKNNIFKLKLDPKTGKVKDQAQSKIIPLKKIIENDPILKRFTAIPSKENGIDIEGIATDGNILYLGFRGPVLRLNYVPVMVIEDSDNLQYELRFVDLRGNGIRDLIKVKDGFLIVAGAVGDALSPYYLYFWNGVDCIPGTEKPQESQLTLLGEIPTPERGKAEGITLMEETASWYKVMVVYDGLPQGSPKLLQVIKPGLLT
ncbi:MAG: DUF3616 domain-containing protein [Cyanobacteria bacterium J06621_8]